MLLPKCSAVFYSIPAIRHLDVLRNFRDFIERARDELTAYAALPHGPTGKPVDQKRDLFHRHPKRLLRLSFDALRVVAPRFSLDSFQGRERSAHQAQCIRTPCVISCAATMCLLRIGAFIGRVLPSGGSKRADLLRLREPGRYLCVELSSRRWERRENGQRRERTRSAYIRKDGKGNIDDNRKKEPKRD